MLGGVGRGLRRSVAAAAARSGVLYFRARQPGVLAAEEGLRRQRGHTHHVTSPSPESPWDPESVHLGLPGTCRGAKGEGGCVRPTAARWAPAQS